MEKKRLRTLALEIFKTLNNLKPNFMEEIFYTSLYNAHRRHGIASAIDSWNKTQNMSRVQSLNSLTPTN